MELKATCRGCDTSYRLPEKAAGKVFACKQCGEKVRVPVPASEPELVEDAFVSPSGEPLGGFGTGFKHTPRKKPLPIKPMAIGGGALLLLIIVGVLIKGMLDGDGKPTQDEPEEANPLAMNFGDKANDDPGLPPELRNRPDRGRPPRFNNSPYDPPDDDLDDPESSDLPPDNPPTRDTQQPDEQPSALSREERSLKRSVEQQRKAWQEARSKFPISPKTLTLDVQHKRIGPIGTWAVTPEPLDERTIWAPRPNLELDINDRRITDVTQPNAYSRFIAVGDNRLKDSKRIVLDLSRGNAVWHLKGSYGSATSPTLLSPDGNTFLFTGGKHGTCFVSRQSRGRAIPLNLERAKGLTRRWCGFVTNECAVLMFTPSRNFKITTILAINPKNNALLWEVTIPDVLLSRGDVAVAPTGRYLAMAAKENNVPYVFLLDTRSGEIAGRLVIPKDSASAPNKLAFSPNGHRLAGSCGGELFVWSLQTGTLEARSVYEGGRTTIGHVPWFSHEDDNFHMIDNGEVVGAAGMFGMRIGDASNGRRIIDPPEEFVEPNMRHQSNRKFPRHIIGPMYLLINEGYDQKARRKKNVLSVGVLDREKLTAAKTIARIGGQAAEVELPKLNETLYFPTLSGAISNDPSTAYDAWPIDLKTSPNQTPSDDAERSIEDLPEVSSLFKAHSVSQDGQFGYYSAGDFRVAKIKLDTEEVVGSWRIKPDPSTMDQYEKKLRYRIADVVEAGENRFWVRFGANVIGDHACLVATDHNQILLSGKVYPDTRQATLDRRYTLIKMSYAQRESQIAVIDTQAGKAIGQLRCGGGFPLTFKISPDGSRVAMTVKDGMMYYLAINDLATNQVLHRNPIQAPILPYRSIKVDWAGQDRVLLDRHWLVQIQTGRYLWKYELSEKLHGQQCFPLNNLILKQVKAPPPLNKKRTHITKEFPFFAKAMQPLIDANPDVTAKASLAVGPGSKIRIDTDGILKSEELYVSLVEQAEAAGLVIDEGATFTLRVTKVQNPRPKRVHAGGEIVTINEYDELSTCEWVAPDGSVMWSTQYQSNAHLTNNIIGELFRQKRDESPQVALQRHLDEKMNDRSPATFKAPMRLPWPAEMQVLGKSVWNSETEQIDEFVKAAP